MRPAIRDVQELRRYLRAQAPARPPEIAVSPSGLEALDALLDGGFPRGAITVLTGLSGAGRMMIAARFLAAETRALRPVAWIDARATLYPPALALEGVTLERLLMIRGGEARSFYALQQILESGAFRGVVASGVEPWLSPTRLRRTQTATEASAVSTILILEPGAAATVASAALRLRVIRRPSGALVEVEKGARFAGRRTYVQLA